MKKNKSFSTQVREEITHQPLDDEKRIYVRDCFLEGGTISNPERSYHLAFTLTQTNAERLVTVLNQFDLNPKLTRRKNYPMVYVKEAEEIVDILNIMAAHKSLLLFENIRVQKDLRNNLNRKINFETANMNKTVSAALGQIKAIQYIFTNTGVGYLDKPLEDVARMRLTHENASLEEIGAMLDPPIGKSGVNHRLRKIQEIATGLGALPQ